MGEAKRRRELNKIRAEIGPEELAKRREFNGKLRTAYGLPGDGGLGDECQLCDRPFREIEITATGYHKGKGCDVGACCWGKLDTIVAIGVYLHGNPPKDKLEAVMKVIQDLHKDGLLKSASDVEGHA